MSKQTLLQQLWADENVVENTVLQGIRDIRRHLGDQANKPTFIKTHPRRGYQWIYAEVSEIEQGSEHPRVKSPRLGVTVALVGILFTIVLGFWWLGNTARNLPSGDKTHRIAVLPFENQTGDPDLLWVEHGLSHMLADALDRFKGLEVVPTLGVQNLIAKHAWMQSETENVAMLAKIMSRHLNVESTLFARVLQGEKGRVLEVLRISANEKVYPIVIETENPAAEMARLANDLAMVFNQEPIVDEEDGFSKDTLANLDFARGLQAFRTQGASLAMAYFQAAMMRDESFLWAKAYRARAQEQLGRWATAEIAYEELLAMVAIPSALGASLNLGLGRIHTYRGENDRAIQFLRAAQSSLPKGQSWRSSEIEMRLERLMKGPSLPEKPGLTGAGPDNQGAGNMVEGFADPYGLDPSHNGEDQSSAQKLLLTAIPYYRAIQDHRSLAFTLKWLGWLEKDEAHLKESLELFHDLEDPHEASRVAFCLGRIAQNNHRLVAAKDHFLTSLQYIENMPAWPLKVDNHRSLAYIFWRLGGHVPSVVDPLVHHHLEQAVTHQNRLKYRNPDLELDLFLLALVEERAPQMLVLAPTLTRAMDQASPRETIWHELTFVMYHYQRGQCQTGNERLDRLAEKHPLGWLADYIRINCETSLASHANPQDRKPGGEKAPPRQTESLKRFVHAYLMRI